MNVPAPSAVPSSPVLFVVAHPDDETLAMCVPIAEHCRAGQDVHVLFMTGGEASGVRNVLNGTGTNGWWGVPHDPDSEGYVSLDQWTFSGHRLVEATTALLALASGYPSTPYIHAAGLADGQVTMLDARAQIEKCADAIAVDGPIRIKTHSPFLDDHPDHRAIGEAARSLAMDEPGRFGDLRHYVLPRYWEWPTSFQTWTDTPADADVRARCINACRSFGAWSPPASFAIGYHSVRSQFATLEADPRSVMHM